MVSLWCAPRCEQRADYVYIVCALLVFLHQRNLRGAALVRHSARVSAARTYLVACNLAYAKRSATAVGEYEKRWTAGQAQTLESVVADDSWATEHASPLVGGVVWFNQLSWKARLEERWQRRFVLTRGALMRLPVDGKGRGRRGGADESVCDVLRTLQRRAKGELARELKATFRVNVKSLLDSNQLLAGGESFRTARRRRAQPDVPAHLQHERRLALCRGAYVPLDCLAGSLEDFAKSPIVSIDVGKVRHLTAVVARLFPRGTDVKALVTGWCRTRAWRGVA